jgi:hypothetical protein
MFQVLILSAGEWDKMADAYGIETSFIGNLWFSVMLCGNTGNIYIEFLKILVLCMRGKILETMVTQTLIFCVF